VSDLKDLVRPLKLDFVRDWTLSINSLNQMYVVPLLTLLEAWRFLSYVVPAVEEIEGGVRKRAKKRVLMPYDPSIL
jgi:hypothetical protein